MSLRNLPLVGGIVTLLAAQGAVALAAQVSLPNGSAPTENASQEQGDMCLRVAGGTTGQSLERRPRQDQCPRICTTEIDGKTWFQESAGECQALSSVTNPRSGKLSLWIPLAALGVGGGVAATLGGGNSNPSSP